jgi:hypothetical protein
VARDEWVPIPLPFDPRGVRDSDLDWMLLVADQAYLYDGPWPCSAAWTGNCTDGQLVVVRRHRNLPGNESTMYTRCPFHQTGWVRDHYGVG